MSNTPRRSAALMERVSIMTALGVWSMSCGMMIAAWQINNLNAALVAYILGMASMLVLVFVLLRARSQSRSRSRQIATAQALKKKVRFFYFVRA